MGPAIAGGPSGTRSFLFSDLRGYTAFVERAGDRAAADLLATYRDLVRSVVATHDGAEIRTEGDSFYVVFPSAAAAVEAGLAIVAHAREASTAERPIRVGIGIHAGETVATTEGLVGGAVNIAARVCSKAQPGEVLVTDTVRALTRTFLPYRFTGLGTQQLKGIAGGIPLYRVESVPSARGARLRRQLSARRRQIGRFVVAALVIGLVGAAVSLYAANRGPDCLTLSPTTRDIAARIDPDRGCVIATYPVGTRPGAIATSGGVVLVANLDAASVSGIELANGRTFTRAVFGSPVAIASGPDGHAYALLRDEQTIGLRPDAVVDRVAWIDGRGSLRETRALPRVVTGGTAGYEALAFADDLAWISDGREGSIVLVRFRSSGLPPPIAVKSGPGLGPIDAGGGSIWIGDLVEAVVYRIDGRGSTPGDIPLPDGRGGVVSMDVTDSAVWLGRADGSLTRLDPGTGGRQTFAVGSRVTAVAAAPGAVWAIDDGAGSVARVNVTTGEAVRIALGGRAAGVATGPDGSVWVTIQGR